LKLSDPVVLATGNRGKLEEIRKLLAGTGITIVPQSEFDFEPAEETGATFTENALLKSRHAANQTGLVAIADDSGLCVDALEGRPGVYTARFAGPGASDEANIRKLLDELAGVDAAQRGAAFHCVTVAAWPGESRPPVIAEGVWHGRIGEQAEGAGGFGYDPVFVDPQLGRCAAQMTADEKNARSHRGQAFRRLCKLLTEPAP
jgi:XTP/dITP diphosphohydrolase